MGNWNNLSMRDKRDVMRLHLQNGVSGLDNIRESYNTYAGTQPGSNQMEFSLSPEDYSTKNKPFISPQERQQIEYNKFKQTNPTFQKPVAKPTAADKAGDFITDMGSRTLNALTTFGGSVIGDAIQDVSPSAANTVSKYSLGMIQPTSQGYLNSNRSNDQTNNWNNRINNSANAVSSQLLGDMIGTGVNKVGNAIANVDTRIASNLTKDNLKTITYNNITPYGYSGHSNEIKGILKDIVGKDNPKIQLNAGKNVDAILSSFGKENANTGTKLGNRDYAFSKYLGVEDKLPIKDNPLYIDNGNWTFRYNDSKIDPKMKYEFLNQDLSNGKDLLTTNGGNVGRIKIVDTENPDIKIARMDDVWDLNPLKTIGRPLPKFIRNMEVGETSGIGKPFRVVHDVPFRYNGNEKIPVDMNGVDLYIKPPENNSILSDKMKSILSSVPNYNSIYGNYNINNILLNNNTSKYSKILNSREYIQSKQWDNK